MSRYTLLLTAGCVVMGCVATTMLFTGNTPLTQAKNADAEKNFSGKVGHVNISQVLKRFDYANDHGQRISSVRQIYVDQANELRIELAEIQKKVMSETDEAKKNELRERALKATRKLEDLDRKAQAELTELSDKTIIKVHDSMQAIIAELAKEGDYDSIQIYPGIGATEKVTGQVAAVALQSPACRPMFVRENLELTEEVIKRLNKKHPVAKTKKED